MLLPPVQNPFPVKTRFETSVDLYKMGSSRFGDEEQTLIRFDAAYPKMIEDKLDVFESHPGHSMLTLDDDLEGLETCFWEIMAQLASDQPKYLSLTSAGFQSMLLGITLSREGEVTFDRSSSHFPELAARAYDFLQALRGVKRTGAMLALSIQEDHVVMRNQSGEPNDDVAESLFVALPTHWDPLDQLGKNLWNIHVPVGDNERLLRSSARLIKAMIEKGPFYRYNWALANLDLLCQNPVILETDSLFDPNEAEAATADALINQLFFRVERQALLNYPKLQRGLFLIRIYQRPLREAIDSRKRAQQLATSIRSMSQAHLEYRAMDGMADLLVAGLEAWHTKE